MSETPAYRAFRKGFFAARSYADAKDGCPVELLDALDSADRAKAEDALIAKLSPTETWPVIGLGHMRSKKALPALCTLLERASLYTTRANIAVAVWRIAQDDKMCDVVVKLSRDCEAYSQAPAGHLDQIDLVWCLARFHHPAARDRLKELERSSDSIVAANARDAFKGKHRR